MIKASKIILIAAFLALVCLQVPSIDKMTISLAGSASVSSAFADEPSPLSTPPSCEGEDECDPCYECVNGTCQNSCVDTCNSVCSNGSCVSGCSPSEDCNYKDGACCDSSQGQEPDTDKGGCKSKCNGCQKWDSGSCVSDNSKCDNGCNPHCEVNSDGTFKECAPLCSPDSSQPTCEIDEVGEASCSGDCCEGHYYLQPTEVQCRDSSVSNCELVCPPGQCVNIGGRPLNPDGSVYASCHVPWLPDAHMPSYLIPIPVIGFIPHYYYGSKNSPYPVRVSLGGYVNANQFYEYGKWRDTTGDPDSFFDRNPNVGLSCGRCYGKQ